MLRQRVREGARAGLVAAAATAGLLIGLGSARHAAMRPLNSAAHLLIGSRAYYMEGFHWLVTPIALLTHVAAVMLWGVCFAAMSARWRGWALYAGAIAFAALTCLFDLRVLPDRFRPGFESGLSSPEIAVVYLVLGASAAWALARERAGATAPMEPGN